MRRTFVALFVCVVLAVAAGGVVVAAAASASSKAEPVPSASVRIPILVYHHIRPTKGYAKSTWSWKMSVTPSVFEKQMQWIADHGYTTVSMDTLAAILKGERAGPAKPVVITFDDNNRTAYDVAFPVLVRHGFIGVYYLVTNRLDNKGFIPRDLVLTMVAAGMDVQSHSVTHATLTYLSGKKLQWELAESRRVLQELTGKPVLHIAYPSTMHNKTVREAAKAAGYVTGTIMDPRTATAKDDLFKLPRIMMTDDTKLEKVLP